jgi:hypothetical protein
MSFAGCWDMIGIMSLLGNEPAAAAVTNSTSIWKVSGSDIRI